MAADTEAASAEAAAVRALIARHWLVNDETPPRLGAIILRAHQREAAARLRRVITAHGGALLADEVGLGKTFTALAAARDARALVVVCPAALTDMWRDALARSGRHQATVISHERLSRTLPALDERPGLVIVDEAHHARNPGTRRYAHLAALTRGAPVLLLSATPLHNTPRDLHALVALFLGTRAFSLGDDALARYIVRRTRTALPIDAPVPAVAGVEWLPVAHAPEVLDAILAVPPPCPARDGGVAAALVTLSLLRHWGSSAGALRASLRRRLGRAESLLAALEEGRHPTRRELGAWVVGDDAVQLAFPELVITAAPDEAIAPLLAAVRRHAAGLRTVRDALRGGDASDAERAARLRKLRARFPSERIVAFTQYAETAAALYALLARDGHVALLTSHGARVAGGRLARREALERFAPHALGVPPPHPAEEIRLLLSTDLLSEGVNLHDASIVVHLDLPWTAARLEQRVGRVRRMGSAHAEVRVYALAPPFALETLLRLQRRVREKARWAHDLLGDIGPLLPGATVRTRRTRRPRYTSRDVDASIETSGLTLEQDAARSPTECQEALRALLARWTSSVPDETRSTLPGVAAIRAARDGFLALVSSGTGPFLVAALGRAPPSSAPCRVLEVALHCDAPAVPVDPAAEQRARRRLARWIGRRIAADSARGNDTESAAHRACFTRIARIVATAPAHRRAALAPLATQARLALARARGAGAEQALGALAAREDGDESWLRELPALTPAREAGEGDVRSKPRVVAMMLLQRG